MVLSEPQLGKNNCMNSNCLASASAKFVRRWAWACREEPSRYREEAERPGIGHRAMQCAGHQLRRQRRILEKGLLELVVVLVWNHTLVSALAAEVTRT
jgi:hypothetical protein